MAELRQGRRTLVAQIRDEILNLLREGQYGPGDQLPSEADLVARFHVNRSTVREALMTLQQEHMIITRHGFGRFVAPNPSGVLTDDIAHLQGITELAAGQGIPLGTRVFRLQEALADETVCTALDLQPDDMVVQLERVRLTNDFPIIYSVDIFPRRLVTDEFRPEDFQGSLVAIMAERWHTELAYAKASISAVLMDAEVSRAIEVPEGIPWLLMEQVNYDPQDHPILYSRDYHRTDSISFSVLRRRLV